MPSLNDFDKVGKICHVWDFFGHFRREKCRKWIIIANTLKFGMLGLHVVGSDYKKLHIILSL